MEQHIGRLIKMIDESLARRANNSLQAHNLTLGQSHILMKLQRAENETLPLKTLEKHFHLAQSTIAGLAARLEAKGLVVSVQDEHDRRVKQIRLTEAGRAVCACSRARIEEGERILKSNLSEEETTLLIDMLNRVYQAIK